MKDHASSWIVSANHNGFTLAHLPYCAFIRPETGDTRLGVGVGEYVLDLRDLSERGLLAELGADTRAALQEPNLNALAGLGARVWLLLRRRLQYLLTAQGNELIERETGKSLLPMSELRFEMPVSPGDYTDFYASLHHAIHVGRLFRPQNPLLTNYKYLPIAYHGRCSSLIPSGTPVRRPQGQMGPAEGPPQFGPSRRLDYELELGLIIGPGNELGQPISIATAEAHIFGVCLVNDWSARDIQAWEYQPLGPFLGKNFATSLGHWVTPWAALEPFRIAAPARPQGDPEPLPYLDSSHNRERGGLDLQLEVWLETEKMRLQGYGPVRLCAVATRELYWTPAQMIAHHTSNGCRLRPGDLLATGTVSGDAPDALGCLLEMTQGGQNPIRLPGDETRAFLESGDEVTLRGSARTTGGEMIELGACAGRIMN